MIFSIYKQYPKPKLIVRGCLSVTREGFAIALDEKGVKAVDIIERAKVDWIQVKGIMVSGFEDTGIDRTGRKKYRYQEWYCGYMEGE